MIVKLLNIDLKFLMPIILIILQNCDKLPYLELTFLKNRSLAFLDFADPSCTALMSSVKIVCISCLIMGPTSGKNCMLINPVVSQILRVCTTLPPNLPAHLCQKFICNQRERYLSGLQIYEEGVYLKERYFRGN